MRSTISGPNHVGGLFFAAPQQSGRSQRSRTSLVARCTTTILPQPQQPATRLPSQQQNTAEQPASRAMDNPPRTQHFPGHLPFPVTITSLLVPPGTAIKKHDGLLVYKFFSFVSEDGEDGEDRTVRKEMVEQFDSPWEGVLKEWFVKEGSIVSSSR